MKLHDWLVPIVGTLGILLVITVLIAISIYR